MNKNKFKFFIFGNGLDLDLGFKTKYSDFVEYIYEKYLKSEEEWLLRRRSFPVKNNNDQLKKYLKRNI